MSSEYKGFDNCIQPPREQTIKGIKEREILNPLNLLFFQLVTELLYQRGKGGGRNWRGGGRLGNLGLIISLKVETTSIFKLGLGKSSFLRKRNRKNRGRSPFSNQNWKLE